MSRLKNAARALAGKNTDCTIYGVFGGKFHAMVIEDGEMPRAYIGKGSALQDFRVSPGAMDSKEFSKLVELGQHEYE